MDRGSFLSAIAAMGATTALGRDDRMTDDQHRFIVKICEDHNINPQAWLHEPDALNVALMMIELLWGHVRVLQVKVSQLEGSDYARALSNSPGR